MSRGAVEARKQAKREEQQNARLDDFQRRIEQEAALDAVLAACEGCGLKQVASGMSESPPPCVVCGCNVGRFLELLPGHHRFASEAAGEQASTLDRGGRMGDEEHGDEVQGDKVVEGGEVQHAEPHEQEVVPGPSAPEPPNAPEEQPQTAADPAEPAPAEPAPAEPAPGE